MHSAYIDYPNDWKLTTPFRRAAVCALIGGPAMFNLIPSRRSDDLDTPEPEIAVLNEITTVRHTATESSFVIKAFGPASFSRN